MQFGAPAYAVRPAVAPQDYRQVAAVHRRAFYPSAHPLLAALLEWDRATGLASTRDTLPAGSHSLCLLAESSTSGEVVAAASVEASPDRFRRRSAAPRGYVSNVAVAAEHRRRGLATLLLESAQRQARDWGCSTLLLHCVAEDVGNRKLYARAGFRTVALEPVWMPLLQLRPRVRLVLLAKRLRPSTAAARRDVLE